jgi:RecJ-like exonuclease
MVMFSGDKLNPDLSVHNYECTCCSGNGNYEDVDVYCDGVKRTVHIMMFTECGCEKCTGGKFNREGERIS